jgi:hypothetical protein
MKRLLAFGLVAAAVVMGLVAGRSNYSPDAGL